MHTFQCLLWDVSWKKLALKRWRLSHIWNRPENLGRHQGLPPAGQILRLVEPSRQHARWLTGASFPSQGLPSRAPASRGEIQCLPGFPAWSRTKPAPCPPVGWLPSDSCLSHSSRCAQCSWHILSSFTGNLPPGQDQAFCSASLLLPHHLWRCPTNNRRRWVMATASPSLLCSPHVQSPLRGYTMQMPQVCSIFSEHRTKDLSELLILSVKYWRCDCSYCLQGRRFGKPASWEAMSALESSDSSEVPGSGNGRLWVPLKFTQQLQMANLKPLSKFCKTVLQAAFPGTAANWLWGTYSRPPITVEPVQQGTAAGWPRWNSQHQPRRSFRTRSFTGWLISLLPSYPPGFPIHLE